ncbi:MAG: EAL domain-containing protein [Acidimicrobiales bacterium]
MATNLGAVRTLRRVLATPELLEVHFQPIVCFDSKHIIGAESLLRVSVARQLVPPALLVEAAMASGAERELGSAVLNQVCRTRSEWPEGLTTAVNVAPSELNDPNFAADAEAVMERWDVDPSFMTFEITEDWVTPDDQLITNLERLVEIGCEVALDDFGTGFSSLSHLRSLPLTAVKLDRTFVERIDESGPESEIIRSVIQMSHALGHSVIAEGVETIEQLRALESFGCDRWQGYLCSPAVEPDKFVELIDGRPLEISAEMAESIDFLGRRSPSERALDSFVFRRTSSSARWSHVGGHNRGSGWAGIIEVDEIDAPIIRSASEQSVVRVVETDQKWLLGPYHPAAAVAVSVDVDTVVIFGSTTAAAMPEKTDQAWQRWAASLAAEIGSVSAAKLLADELEQSEALHTMMSGSSMTIETTTRHIVETIADALSCEFGLVYLETLDQLATTASTPCDFDVEVMKAELKDLRAGLIGQQCVQDSEHRPFPLSVCNPSVRVRSWMVIPVAPAFGGVILCAHTSRNPRGFTTLCQRLGARLATAANLILETAAEREALHQKAVLANAEARRDPLTGLANRLAWDEALETCVDRKTTAIIVDLDDLKGTNDTLGHAAGDRLIEAMAQALQRASRSTDTIARIGGDEFGVLLHDAEGRTGHDFVDRLLHAADGEIEFSYGVAVRTKSESVRQTVHRADTAMYKNKRSRRLLYAT